MKLAVFGSYNGTSIGDTAILLGLLRAIAHAVPKAQVTVLTMGPLDLSRDLKMCGLMHSPRFVRANVLAPAEWPLLRSLWWRAHRLGLPLGIQFNYARVRRILDGQDLLIIGGGNLLMDLFGTNVDLIESITRASRAEQTPYCFAGVGAGPIDKAASRHRLSACLLPAKRVLVRDARSLALCVEGLGRADTSITPDLAFALPPYERNVPRVTLAVNVAAVGAITWPVQDAQGYHHYLDGMCRLVLEAAARTKPARIEIVTSNPAVDLVAARDLAARLAGKTELPVLSPDLSDVTGILDVLARAKLAIITRLHTGIMAALAGAPVLPVAYQPKVAAVLGETGIAPKSIGLEVLHAADFDAGPILDTAIRHGAGLRPEIRTQVVEAVRDLLSSSVQGAAPV